MEVDLTRDESSVDENDPYEKIYISQNNVDEDI